MKIIEVFHVTPFTDDSPEYSVVSEFSLPVTYYDTMLFKYPPVEHLNFYSLADSTESLLDSVIPKLKHSLSLALRHFLPIAGTLTWPCDSPMTIILYRAPNDSVTLTVAESDSDFDVLSSYKPRESSSFRDLVPKLEVSESGASVMSVQVTLFPKHRGFSIGFTNLHAVLDAKSATMFHNSWAHLCRHMDYPPPLSLPPALTPFFDRSTISDPKGMAMYHLKRWSGDINPRDDPKLFESLPTKDLPPDFVRATFLLTSTDLANLRRKISDSENYNSEQIRLSSFVVAYSHTFVSLLKATEDGGDDGRPAKVLVGFGGDLRRRSDPPLPDNYFGNCVGSAAGYEDARKAIPSADLSAAAAIISRMVRVVEACRDINEGSEERRKKFVSLLPAQFVGVSGSPRFNVYGLDFGWGLPRKVDFVSIDRSGSISMMESRDETGGIEVGLAMNKHQMEIFTRVFNEGLN